MRHPLVAKRRRQVEERMGVAQGLLSCWRSLRNRSVCVVHLVDAVRVPMTMISQC